MVIDSVMSEMREEIFRLENKLRKKRERIEHLESLLSPKIEPSIVYERKDDMSTTGVLLVTQQPDGDMGIAVKGGNSTIIDDLNPKEFHQQLEFRFPCGGGGRSPHTRNALIVLAIAIERDNKENPIEDNF